MDRKGMCISAVFVAIGLGAVVLVRRRIRGMEVVSHLRTNPWLKPENFEQQYDILIQTLEPSDARLADSLMESLERQVIDKIPDSADFSSSLEWAVTARNSRWGLNKIHAPEFKDLKKLNDVERFALKLVKGSASADPLKSFFGILRVPPWEGGVCVNQ